MGRAISLGALLLIASACQGSAPTPEAATDSVEAASGYVEGAAGARLHYRVVGSAPDTVVVLHGGPGAGMHSVLPPFEPLSKDLTLVFFDQRGGGRSTLPADTTLLHARYFVEDLEAVRRHFGLEALQLLTHSFGAIVAARYARDRPERVEAMVFHGATGPARAAAARLARRSPPSPDTALSERAAELLGALLAGRADDPVAACREWEAAGRELARKRGESVTWNGSVCEMPPEAVRYYFRHTAQYAPRTFGDWDFTDELAHLEPPLLVVTGTADSAFLATQRAWVDAVPRSRLLVVPGAGKSAVTDRPDVVIPAIVDFFRSVGSGDEAEHWGELRSVEDWAREVAGSADA